MNKYFIFVEGKSDKKFLKDYMEYLGIRKNIEIVEIKSNCISAHKPTIERYNDLGYINIIIFDADNDPKRISKEIRQIEKEIKSTIDFFLFPDNISNGNLEDLILSCVHDKHKSVVKCFDSYITCISESNKQYSLPNQKAKVYAYCEALSQNGDNIKDCERDFLDKETWDLNAPMLDNLKSFLLRVIV